MTKFQQQQGERASASTTQQSSSTAASAAATPEAGNKHQLVINNGVILTNEYNGTIRIRMKTLAIGWNEVTIGTLNRGDRATHRCCCVISDVVGGGSAATAVRVQVKFDDRSIVTSGERSITVGSKYGRLGLKHVTVTRSGTLTTTTTHQP